MAHVAWSTSHKCSATTKKFSPVTADLHLTSRYYLHNRTRPIHTLHQPTAVRPLRGFGQSTQIVWWRSAAPLASRVDNRRTSSIMQPECQWHGILVVEISMNYPLNYTNWKKLFYIWTKILAKFWWKGSSDEFISLSCMSHMIVRPG